VPPLGIGPVFSRGIGPLIADGGVAGAGIGPVARGMGPVALRGIAAVALGIGPVAARGMGLVSARGAPRYRGGPS
jgi:hypothetical protein